MAERGQRPRPGFVAAADGLRLMGDSAEAERMLRHGLEEDPGCSEGAAVLALLLIDEGRTDEARHVLARWVESKPSGIPDAGPEPADEFALSDAELESAFDAAETDREQVIDADAVAQQAMRQADLDDLGDDLVAVDSNFATRTVADLLERQGDQDGASRIRAIVESTSSRSQKPSDERGRTIEQLERWLANLKGEVQ